jgi:parallel beta-helix repeat protein
LINNIIIGNASWKDDYGVFLDEARDITLTNNTMIHNGIFIYGWSLVQWNTHNIDTSNTVNSKPIYYYKNQTGGFVPLGSGQIILANCTNFSIGNQELTNSYVGIGLGFSSNCNIANNILYSNYYGIYLSFSAEIIIHNNNASNNSYGIYIYYSDENNLTNNNASSNGCGIFAVWSDYNGINNCNISFNSDDGIFFGHSRYNRIHNNIISSNNDEGIVLDYSDYNEIHYNTISSNNDYGLWVYGNCKIFFNNFINNTNQAHGGSDWDNGYPSGGNYWSDYGGPDNYSGPNQNIPGSDGIGDNFYYISFGFFDRYPLLEVHEKFDSRGPIIVIVSPANNSTIKPGVVLDFEVYDSELDFVNYSMDGDPVQPFISPYYLVTDGWQDGIHEVVIQAKDILNNSASKTFYFTIDSKMPNILLNTPSNNSIVKGGTVLDFSIADLSQMNVIYSIDDGFNTSLSEPFNISTEGWENGVHIIQIYATDFAGNSNTSWFSITTDSTQPQIILNSPINNSVIQKGIFLNFSVLDTYSIQVNYSINGEENISLSDPYDISTAGWPDGEYTVQINTLDQVGNSNFSWFFFTVDSTPPEIVINSPLNNSIIPAGTLLNFSVIDPIRMHVNYSLDKGIIITLSEPFEISTEGWVDGAHMVQINAINILGNSNSSLFTFTIDSTPPSIYIDPNLNRSTLCVGKPIQLNISDPNLRDVMYLLDARGYIALPSPYIINTSELPDGVYIIMITANDTAGNKAIRWFEVTIDAILPYVVSSVPTDKSEDVDIDTTIIITFSEPMNLTDTENHISLDPHVDFSCHWNQQGHELTIIFYSINLSGSTTYLLTIDSRLADINGNPLSTNFTLEFTTKAEPQSTEPDPTEPQPSPASETTFPLWIIALISIIAVIIIILLFLLGNIRKKGTEEKSEVVEEDEEVEGEIEEESPEDESSQHEERPIKKMWKLKCPNCKKIFKIVGEERPNHVKCSKCGKKWRMPEEL